MKKPCVALPTALRSLRAILTLPLLTFSACATLHAQAPTPPPVAKVAPDPLLSDPRLERKITLEQIAITLPDLLKKLAGSDLLLIAAKNCETQKIQLRVQNRSVRSVMLALAQLLPGYWREADNKKGYTLRVSDAYERKRDKWWQLFEAEREAAFGRMKDNIVRDLLAKHKLTEEDGSPLKDKELNQELDAVQRFCKALPPDLVDKIAGNIDRRPYFSSGSIQFGGSRDRVGHLILPLAELSDEAKRAAIALTPPSRKREGKPIYLRIVNEGFSISFGLYDASNQGVGGALCSPDAGRINLVFTTPNHRGLYQMLMMDHKSMKILPPNWQKLLDYQRSSFWTEQKQPWPPQQILMVEDRADLLSRMGKNTGAEFIADYYTQQASRVPPETTTEKVRPPEVELNRLALKNDISWKKSGDFYLVRNNRWYRDDRLEAPEEILTKWFKTWAMDEKGDYIVPGLDVKEEAGFKQFRERLEEHSEIISSMTLWQLMNGFRYGIPAPYKSGIPEAKLEAYIRVQERGSPQRIFTEAEKSRMMNWASHPYAFLAPLLLNNLYVLQFYASLDKVQRDRLLFGDLAVDGLSTSQRDAVFVILPDLIPLLEQKNRRYRLKLVPQNQSSPDDYSDFTGKLVFEPIPIR